MGHTYTSAKAKFFINYSFFSLSLSIVVFKDSQCGHRSSFLSVVVKSYKGYYNLFFEILFLQLPEIPIDIFFLEKPNIKNQICTGKWLEIIIKQHFFNLVYFFSLSDFLPWRKVILEKIKAFLEGQKDRQGSQIHLIRHWRHPSQKTEN